MPKRSTNNKMDRRQFTKLSAVAASSSLFLPSVAQASSREDAPAILNQRSTMTYKQLGRSKFMSSRLVFGSGAALMYGKGTRLLDRAFEAGVNNYDIGSDVYYKQSERTFAPFMKANRNDIWVTSKAPIGALRQETDDSFSLEKAKSAAAYWSKLLDASLKDLQTDYVDAYYLMAVSNPIIIKCEELYQAFLTAKSAGKVGHFGVSTHKNAETVLKAAIETGWYDFAMIGITPAGWYDWTTKEIAEGTPTLKKLQPFLQQAKDAGIGLVGMKSVRYLAPMKSAGKGNPSAFDEIYNDKFKASSLNPYQRSYAYVLEHGLDVVNADMQNFKHLEENIIAAATSHTYFG